MDGLKKKIQQRIEGKRHCTIFSKDIEKIYRAEMGIDPKLRKAVNDFARENGWQAKIVLPGLRVIFRKKEE